MSSILTSQLTKNATRLLLLLSFCLFIQTAWAATRTSSQSGPWNNTATWGGLSVPIAGDDVIISAGHVVTLDVNTANALNSLTINATGTLSATAAFLVRSTTISVNGTYNNGSTGAITVTTMNVNGGGTYVHARDGGTIPTATWATTSNCNITGVTGTTPAGFAGQSFGNLNWNSPGQNTNIYLQSSFTVLGNFSVLDTGLPLNDVNRALRMSNTGTGYTINVSGDFSIANSSFKMNNNTGPCIMNVGGNFNLNSGYFAIVSGGANSTLSVTGDVNILSGTLEMHEDASVTVGTLNVGGNFTHTGGLIDENQNGAGSIVFNKAGTQTYTSGGTVSNTINFTVNSGATLQMVAPGTTLTGGGNFTLLSGATLGVTSTAGITTAGLGNIQVAGTRTYSTGANYIYNNGSALQDVGNGLTQFTPANLIINNPGNIVRLGTATSLSGTLTITSGTLNANGQTMVVGGLTTVNGTYQASTALQTLNGGLTISGGTFTGSSGNVTATDITLSSGTLTAPSGAFNVTGNWTKTGGTFTPGVGVNTVTFTRGAGTQTLNSGGSPFNNISHTGAGTLQLLTSALTTGGTFTNSVGSFDANGIAHTVTGLATVSGGTYLASTATQTFNGGLTISGGTVTGSSGTITTTDVTLSSGTLTAPSGTFNVSGNWLRTAGTFTPGANTVTFTKGAGTQTLNSGGSSFNNISHTGAGTLQLLTNTLATGGIFTNSAGSFDANGVAHTVTGLATVSGGSYLASTATQTFNGGHTISGGVFTGASGSILINGNLAIGNASGLTVANSVLSVTGTTVVGGGATGTLTVSSSTGAKTFAGLVTVSAGGTWNNSGNSPITFQGGITRSSGTFNAGSGIYTFDTNTQSLIGTFSIPNVTVTGVTLNNNNSLTIATALSGSGDLTQASGSALLLGGTSTIASLNAINTNNTVTYNGTAQAIQPTTYYNFNLSQLGSTVATLSGNASVLNTLTFGTDGRINTGINKLTLATTATAIVGANTARYVIGNLEWALPAGANPDRKFEIGGTAYAPTTLKSANITGAVSITANAQAGTPPNENTPVANSSGIDQGKKVGHYWTLNKNGAGTFSTNVEFDFGSTPLIGAPVISNFRLRKYDPSPTFWTAVPANVVGNLITSTTPITSFSDFEVGEPNTDLAITTQPNPVTVCSGGSATFTIVATGTPAVSYQWRKGAVNITGATAASYNINPVVAGDAGTYDCVVSNINGSVTSIGGVSLTVNPLPTLTGVLQAAAVCDGNVATMNLAGLLPGSTSTVNYTINAVAQAPVFGVVANGSGAASFTTPVLTIANNGQLLRITGLLVTSAVPNCSQTFTQNTLLSVNAIPVVNSAATKSICSGVSVNYIPTAAVGGTVFNWTSSVTVGTVTGNTAVGGLGTIADVLVNTTNVIGTVRYVITPVANGCTGTPFNVDVTVDPQPTLTTIITPLSQVICSNTAMLIDVISATVPSAGSVVYDYVAVASDVSVTGFTASATNQSLATNISNLNVLNSSLIRQTITYTITPHVLGGLACAGPPVVVVISIDPVPSVSSAATKSICSGVSVNYIPTAAVGGTVFNWTSSVTVGTVTGNTAVGGLGTIADVLVNTTNVIGTVRYVITPVANGCTGTPFNVDVTVDPQPTLTTIITPLSQVICSNTAMLIDVISATVPSAGSVVYDYVAVASDVSVTGFTASAVNQTLGTNISNLNVLNSSLIRQTITYTITPHVLGGLACAGPSIIVVMSIDPVPVVNSAATKSICSGVSVNYIPTAAVGGTVFNWTSSVTVGTVTGNTAVGGLGTIADVLVNTTNVIGTVRYVITPVANGCSGTPFNVDVTVDPQPTLTTIITPLSQVICSNTAMLIDVNSATVPSAGSVVYDYTAVASDVSVTGFTASAINQSLATNISNLNVLNSSLIRQTITYTITPHVLLGLACSGPPVVVVISIDPVPSVSSAATKSICSGVSVNYIPTAAVGGTVFNWTSSVTVGTVTGNTAVGGLGTIADVLVNTTNVIGTVRYVITPVANGCTGTPFNVDVTVDPQPTLTTIITPLSQVICSNTAMLIDVISATVPSAGSVVYDYVAVASDVSVTGFTASAVNQTLGTNISNLNVLNSSLIRQTITYTITPHVLGGLACAGPSIIVVMSIDPVPVVNSAATKSICSGVSVNYIPTAAVGGTVFNWTSSVTVGTVTGNTAVGGLGTIADVLVNTTNVIGTVRYVITPVANGCSGTPFNVDVTVDPQPTLTTIITPLSQVICSNTAMLIDVISATVPSAGSVVYDYTAVASDVSVTGFTASAINQSLATNISNLNVLNSSLIRQTITYTITPHVLGGLACAGPSIIVVMSIDPVPVVNSAATKSICSGVSVNYIPTAAVGGTVFNWTSSVTVGTVTGNTAVGGLGTIADVLVNTTNVIGTVRYVITPVANGCSGTPFNVDVTVDPQPTLTTIITPLSQVICSNTAMLIDVISATVPSAGSVVYDYVAVASDVSVTGFTASATNQSLATNISNLNVLNSSLIRQTITYTITPHVLGGLACAGPSIIVVMSIDPVPVVNSAATKSICSGVSVNYVPTAAVGGTVFNWTSSVTVGTVTGNTAVGGLGTIADVLVNTTNVIGTVRYVITPVANGCTGTPFNVDVTVDPQPTLSTIVAPLSQVICSNTAMLIDVISATVPSAGSVVYDYVAVASDVSVTGFTASATNQSLATNISNLNVLNSSLIRQTITYTITPHVLLGLACSGPPVVVVISIDPVPSVSSAATKSICSGVSVNYIPTAAVGGTVFNWTSSVTVGTVTGNTAVGGLGTIADVLVNTTNVIGTVRYVITPVANGCTGTPFNVDVTVDPQPTLTTIITPLSQVICSNTAMLIDVISATVPSAGSVVYDYVAVASDVSVTGFTASAVNQTLGTNISNLNVLNSSLIRQTITYTITPHVLGGLACAGPPVVVVISIDPVPSVSSAATKSICSGVSVNYIPTAAVGGTVFNWTSSVTVGTVTGNTAVGGLGTIADVLVNTTNVIGTVRYVITPVANGCTGTPFNVDVTVDPQPTLTTIITPLSQVICSNTAMLIDVISATVPSAGSVVYDYVAVASDVSVTGFTASAVNQTLGTNISNLNVLNSSLIRQTITYTITPHVLGGLACAGPSIIVVMSIDPVPVVNSAATKSICSGVSVNYIPTAAVGGTVFNWTSSVTVGTVTGNTAVGGLGTIADVLVNTTNVIGTVRYVITPVANGCSGTPFNVDVTVDPQPTLTTIITPLSQVICSNTAMLIDVISATVPSAGSVVYDYVAVASDVSVTGFTASATNQSLATNISNLNVLNSSLIRQTITYTITPHVLGGLACAGPSIIVVMSIDPVPVVNSAATKSICSGVSVNYIPTAAVGGTVFNWTSSVTVGTVTGNTAVGGLGTIADVLVNTTNVIGTVRYVITPVANGCTGTPFNVDVTVDPQPTLSTIVAPLSQVICSNTAMLIDVISATVPSAGSVVYDYVAVASDVSVTGFTASATNQSLATNISNLNVLNSSLIRQTITYTITPHVLGGLACAGPSIIVVMSIDPVPVVNSAATKSICSGVSVNYIPTAAVGGTVFNWTSSVTVGTVTGNTAVGGLGTIADVLVNTTNVIGTVRYVITPVANGCSGTPFNVDVTVDPQPTLTTIITPLSQVICSNTAMLIDVISATVPSAGSVVYDYTAVASDVSVTGFTASAINQSLATNISNLNVLNSSLIRQTITYTITPHVLGGLACAGPSIIVVMSIDPVPVVNSAATKSICSGVSVNYIPTAAVGGTVFNWTSSVTVGTVTGNTAVGGLGTIADVLVNTTNVIGTVRYVITPVANGCSGTPFNVDVTVDPQPTLTTIITPLSQVICSNTAMLIDVISATVPSAGSVVYDYVAVASDVSVTGFTASATNQSLATNISNLNVFNSSLIRQTITYTITPHVLGGLACAGPSIIVVISIDPVPVLTATNNITPTICSSTQTNISVSDLVGGAVIKIIGVTISGAPGNITGHSPVNSTFASGSIITDLLVNTTVSAQTIKYDFQSTANSCAGSVQSITMTVQPNATFSISNGSPTICEGPLTPTSIILSSITAGQQVRIINVTATGGVTGFSPVNTLYNVFPAAIADVLDNPSNVSQTVTYQLEGSLGGTCINPILQSVTVTVNPKPAGANDASIVCSDVAINYNLLLNVATMGNNVGSTFTWVATDNPNPKVTGENTAPELGVGPIITDVITNLDNIPQVVNYTVTPTGTNGCIGTSFNIAITVKPEPVGVSTAAPAICSGTIVNYNLQTNVNTPVLGNSLLSNFTWIATADGNVTGESTTVKSGPIIDDVLVNTTISNQTITYTVTPVGQAGSCFGNPFTILVDVNPIQVFSAGPDLSVCVSENDVLIDGTVTYAPSTFTWSGGSGTFDNVNLEKPKYILSFADKAVVVPTNRTLTLTVPGAGACPTLADNMVLTINPRPIVFFTGLPPGAPPQVAENNAPITLTGNQIGGLFTISPITSNIGSTVPTVTGDKAAFDPSAVDLGSNFITYTFTDVNTCVNFQTQQVVVNPVTVIDFTVQGAVLNSTNEFEICGELGLVKLIGFPAPVTGGAPFTQFIGIPAYVGQTPLTIVKTGPDYFIQTTGAPSDNYLIQYDYENSFGAQTSKLRPLKLFASPTAGIVVANNCIISAINFLDARIPLPATPFPTSIASWQWNFGLGEGNSGLQDPSYLYTTSGVKNVSLTVTTLQGCSNTAFQSVRVGDVPVVDYSWSAICTNDNTKYKDLTNPGSISIITNYTWDFGDGDILTGVAGGTVPGGTHGGRTTGTFNDPQHNYVLNGTYSARLTVDTNDGCNNSLTQSVFILPAGTTVTPLPSLPYSVDFEASNAGWIPEGLKISPPLAAPVSSPISWNYGTPTGTTITTASSGSKAWWTGGNGNSYFPSEQSVINGPCFDLTQLTRPMVSLDYWSDAENNLDGAALQYSIDGGLNWVIIGPPPGQASRDEGIEWFNGQGIPSNPGLQPTGNYGWTDKQGKWKNAKFHLDMIPNILPTDRAQVRLRVAFASNATNDPAKTFDGFAVDNFFVGDKKRNVLVEHFTNSSLQASVDGDTWLNNLYQEQITLRGKSDFQDVQYHISFPNADQLNQDNPADPAARALYFGVSQPPATIMDGILNAKFTGKYTDLNLVEISRRALVDPLFELTLDTIPTGVNNTISVKLSIRATAAFNQPLIAQVALIENPVGTFKNVLRKQLLGGDGETINLSWVNGQTLDKNKDNIEINVPIVNSSQLKLVGFVQNKNTKEIYQSVTIIAPKKKGSVVVGLEDEKLPVSLANDILLFPNPANRIVNFSLPDNLPSGYTWKMIDQRGVTIMDGDFNGAVNSIQPVDIETLPNAIYNVIIGAPGKPTVYRKLAVMNRN